MSHTQFNRVFVQKLEMVFTFNDVEALDSGLVFYVFYISILGIFWDPLPPERYDLGLALDLRPIGGWVRDWYEGLVIWCQCRSPRRSHAGVFLCGSQAVAGFSTQSSKRLAGAAHSSQVRRPQPARRSFSSKELTALVSIRGIALEIVFSHSPILASAMTGLIWAMWHWPMIIVDALDMVPLGSGYAVVETREFHLAYVLAAFTLLLVGARIIMCWIQGTSSYIIWPSVVYHATHKLYVVSTAPRLSVRLTDHRC